MSGFSKSDANAILRRALEPNIRKLLCALEDIESASGGVPVVANITPTTTSSSGASSTTTGAFRVSIANVGGAAGTVAGVSIPAGTSLTYEGYRDPVSGGFNRLASIAYDASGTTFLIIEIP